MKTLNLYIDATKPGIVMSNTLLAAAAYVFAAASFDWLAFIGLIIGTAGIVASGCLVNNHIDRGIDQKMTRTAGRGQATGQMSVTGSMVFAAALGLLGVVVLLFATNVLTAIAGVAGWVTYAIVYTLSKHRTVHATAIGTIPGALPPMAGLAATGAATWTDAILLFLAVASWQFVHFYAISIRRGDEYRAASVPVPAVVWGNRRTGQYMVLGSFVYLATVVLFGTVGSAGIVMTIALTAIALGWCAIAVLDRSRTSDIQLWSRRMFLYSLIIILALSALLFVDPLLV